MNWKGVLFLIAAVGAMAFALNYADPTLASRIVGGEAATGHPPRQSRKALIARRPLKNSNAGPKTVDSYGQEISRLR